MAEILAQEGCTAYALDVTKRYLHMEHASKDDGRYQCPRCSDEGHVPTEADAKARREAPVPEHAEDKGAENTSAGSRQDNSTEEYKDTSAEEEYWHAYNNVPHYMNATKNIHRNKNS